MARRLAALLLSAAMIIGGVTACPCLSRAACAIAAAAPEPDCCASKPGIGTPRCCDGKPQLTRTAPPATGDRPVQSTLTAAAMHVILGVPALAAPLCPVLTRRIDAGAAPPGGTLIAQHTSLLL